MNQQQQRLMETQRAARLAKEASPPKAAPKAAPNRPAKSQRAFVYESLRGFSPDGLTSDDISQLFESEMADGLPRDFSQICSTMHKQGILTVVGERLTRLGYPASIYRLA